MPSLRDDLPCVVSSRGGISVRDVGGGIGRNDRTNPRLFAVAIGLEEIETFVAVIVVSV
jgi:hypothetical protein